MEYDMAALSIRERDFVDACLASWTGISTRAPIPVRALGYSDRDHFDDEVGRLRRATSAGEKLSEVDTARVLFLSELAFGSELFGAGIEFRMVSTFDDSEGVAVLRTLQRKLYTNLGARSLFDPELYAPRKD
ncbi:hypothetical protein ACFVAV_03480 [Nocardia sp. NPDC057663]|uniref:hypothetical protein n=1 Tax=Nocardia sp. NPDC057663 TaxID=3346201 RepID=UPI00366F4F04